MWDDGERNRRRISEVSGASITYVHSLLWKECRTTGDPVGRPPTTRVAVVREWMAGERDLERIARTVGSASAGAVKSALNRAGIRLGDGKRRAPLGYSQRRIDIPVALEREARRRGTSTSRLALALLRTVAIDDMYAAVLRAGSLVEIGARERLHLPRALEAEARRRCVTPTELASDVLVCISRDQLYSAVLDDD